MGVCPKEGGLRLALSCVSRQKSGILELVEPQGLPPSTHLQVGSKAFVGRISPGWFSKRGRWKMGGQGKRMSSDQCWIQESQMNTSEPSPTPLPGPDYHFSGSGEQLPNRGALVELLAEALMWLQREKESVLGSSRSSVQEQILWGGPWSPDPAPSSPGGLCPEEATGFVVSGHSTMKSVTWAQAWVPGGQSYCGPGRQHPGTGAAPAGPLLPSSMRHLDPGPPDSWKIISPLRN